MKADFLTRVAALTAVEAITGGNVAWHERRRRDGYEAIVLSEISRDRGYSHEGASGDSVMRVQIDCYSQSDVNAEALAEAAIAGLEPAATVGATAFGQSFVDTVRTLPPEDLPGGIRVHRTLIEMSVWHQAA